MEESGAHSRRRNSRRRPPTPMEEAPVRQGPITQEEFRVGAGESGLSRRRPGRSGTHSQSQASSSAAPPVDGGAADPDTPALPPDIIYVPHWSHRGPFTPREVMVYNRTRGRWRPGARSQASSSSSAPRSDHPGAEGGTHVRQSVLYSGRPRQSRPRRQTLAEEHPGVVSSCELGRLVTDSPTFGALSLIDPPLLTPQTTDAEESDDDEVSPKRVGSGFGFGILGPQTLRYSARPPRPKCFGGVRGQGMLEKHAGDANSSQLDPLITDLSRSEALSVTASSLSRFEKPTEDPDDEFEKHAGDANSSEFDPLITDLSRSEALSATALSLSRSEKPAEDPDDDTEEVLRSLEEYYEAHPPTSFSQAFDELEAANYAALTSLAAEWGIEPPPSRRKFLPVQAQQKVSAAVAHPQHSTLPRKLRQEASDEEIVENAKKWMRDEVTLIFRNYIGRREDLKIVDYHLDELCHQCVSVEDYHNIFHHYNFTVKLKKVNSDDWVSALYFAEVKQMFGRKSYFCCPLEPNEYGHCSACQNQGVDDLRHPATGGFTDVGYGLWYPGE